MSISASTVALTGSDQAVVATGPGVFRGFVAHETSGAAAAVAKIYDNAAAASGTLLAVIDVASGGMDDRWYGNGGIRFAAGIYVHIVSGALEGSVRVG